MDSIPDIAGLSPGMQMRVIQGYLVLKVAGSLYSTIRNGGGMKRMFTSFWLGENVPKPIAEDYKAELSKPTNPSDTPSSP